MWSDLFSKDQVLVIYYGELKSSPQLFLDQITNFLGIKSIDLDIVENSKRINQTTTPKYFYLAKFFAKIVDFLRKNELHSVVEFGKRLGLKSVYDGGKDKRNYAEERDWLEKQFLEADFLSNGNENR